MLVGIELNSCKSDFKVLLKKVSFFIRQIYGLKRTYNHGELFFMSNVIGKCCFRLFRGKLCPGSETEFQ